jgi:hypothetical protein
MNDTKKPDSDPTADTGDGILRSDPQHRRYLQWLIGAMVVALLLLWLFGRPALKRWIDVSDLAIMVHRWGIVSYCLSALLFTTAAYAGWYASRIFRSAQFPPPGSWVLRDTRVLRGDHARARGWWVVACAISLALISAYVMILPGRIAGVLLSPAMRHSTILAKPHG